MPPAYHNAMAIEKVNKNVFVFSANVTSATRSLTQKADIQLVTSAFINFSYHIAQTQIRDQEHVKKKKQWA